MNDQEREQLHNTGRTCAQLAEVCKRLEAEVVKMQRETAGMVEQLNEVQRKLKQ